jgi:hypothetical protein
MSESPIEPNAAAIQKSGEILAIDWSMEQQGLLAQDSCARAVVVEFIVKSLLKKFS